MELLREDHGRAEAAELMRARSWTICLVATVAIIAGCNPDTSGTPSASTTTMTTTPVQACWAACLFAGTAHLQLDDRFHPATEMRNHLEASTVFFNGSWRMYYRTFRFAGGECPFPTGIALATSVDGDTWTVSNAGLPLEGLATVPACPATAGTVSVWRYAPSVVVDGASLRMAYESRTTLVANGRAFNRVDAISSSDGMTWSGDHTIISPGAVGAWNEEVGTPDLVRDGNVWKVGFHANRPSEVVRALAIGGGSFENPFAVLGTVIGPQSPARFPNPGWFGHGVGLGSTIREGDFYYQVFEGWTGTGQCGLANLETPRVGIARSTDLVHWEVSAASPLEEVSQDSSACGHDMPHWQQRPNGEATIVTPADPPDGAPPDRWRIVPGPPRSHPVTDDRLGWNQYLDVGQQLVGSGGHVLRMQSDGNLVLIATGNVAIWASNTSGHPGAVAALQDDGNLVIIAPGNAPLCASGTNGHPGSRLSVGADGNLAIRSAAGTALWSTAAGNTCH